MTIEFNVGELVQRLRRSLVTVGRLPLDLDERCQINVEAFSMDAAPWRSEGARFYRFLNLAPSVGNFSTIACGSGAAGAGAVHVVDGVWITNTEATLGDVQLGIPSFAITGVGQAFCRYYERGDPLGATVPAIAYAPGPAQLTSMHPATSAFAANGADISITIAPNTTVYLPLEVTIQNAATGFIQYAVETGAVNRGLRVAFTGRTFNQNPQLR